MRFVPALKEQPRIGTTARFFVVCLNNAEFYYFLYEVHTRYSQDRYKTLEFGLRDKTQGCICLKTTGKLTQRLVDLFMSTPGADSLRRAFTVYLAKTLKIKEIMPDYGLDDITGANQMLSKTVDSWIQGGFDKGITQGITQGISEGKTLGERTILERQLIKKFGKLTLEQQSMLTQFSENQLLALSEKILFASRLEEILGEIGIAEAL